MLGGVWDRILGVHEGGGAIVLTALVGLLAYLANQLVVSIGAALAARRELRARLIELQSLLAASKVSFDIQAEHRDRLADVLRAKYGEPAEWVGYEEFFAGLYGKFSPDEKELHGLIRGITTFALRPANREVLRWLADDKFFRGRATGRYGRLARTLALLQAHLILWEAKYQVWIPDHPEHALVYLADEKRHGYGFPNDLDGMIAELLGGSLARLPVSPE